MYYNNVTLNDSNIQITQLQYACMHVHFQNNMHVRAFVIVRSESDFALTEEFKDMQDDKTSIKLFL